MLPDAFFPIIITIEKNITLPPLLNLKLLKNIRSVTAEHNSVILPLMKFCNPELEETETANLKKKILQDNHIRVYSLFSEVKKLMLT